MRVRVVTGFEQLNEATEVLHITGVMNALLITWTALHG